MAFHWHCDEVAALFSGLRRYLGQSDLFSRILADNEFGSVLNSRSCAELTEKFEQLKRDGIVPVDLAGVVVPNLGVPVVAKFDAHDEVEPDQGGPVVANVEGVDAVALEMPILRDVVARNVWVPRGEVIADLCDRIEEARVVAVNATARVRNAADMAALAVAELNEFLRSV